MGKSLDHMNLVQPGAKFPFHAPEHYFDDFPLKIMDRISEENKPLQKTFFLQRFFKPAFGFAAGLLIIAGLIYIPARVLLNGKIVTDQSVLLTFDEEFMISYPLADNTIFEALENNIPEDHFDRGQLETVLLASVSEYELMGLTNRNEP